MKNNGTLGSKADEADNEYTSVLADENPEIIYESIRDPIYNSVDELEEVRTNTVRNADKVWHLLTFTMLCICQHI